MVAGCPPAAEPTRLDGVAEDAEVKRPSRLEALVFASELLDVQPYAGFEMDPVVRRTYSSWTEMMQALGSAPAIGDLYAESAASFLAAHLVGRERGGAPAAQRDSHFVADASNAAMQRWIHSDSSPRSLSVSGARPSIIAPIRTSAARMSCCGLSPGE